MARKTGKFKFFGGRSVLGKLNYKVEKNPLPFLLIEKQRILLAGSSLVFK